MTRPTCMSVSSAGARPWIDARDLTLARSLVSWARACSPGVAGHGIMRPDIRGPGARGVCSPVNDVWMEAVMQKRIGRRDFLETMTVLSAAVLASTPAHAQSATGGARMKTAYDPAAKFDLKVSEVEFRRAVSGRLLQARIYQPQGVGPFPTLLDLHGGAWNNKDRFANEPMDRAVAASGVLVVAVDLTLGGEAPYPASVVDGNYGVRWLKSKAAAWNGDA